VNGTSASAAELFRALSQPLALFTAARYSRDGGIDTTALDAALSEGRDVVRRLRRSQWRRFGRMKRHADTASVRQTWAR
jgi:hypothetical protein